MRATPKRFVKTLVVVAVLVFVFMNMSLFMQTDDTPDLQLPEGTSVLTNRQVVFHVFAPRSLNASHITSNKSVLHGSASRYVRIGVNATLVKEYIALVNERQPIYNLDRFDLRSSDNTVVIVVQVHQRIEYLRYLIDSLRKARFIEQALLVFSHDYFDDDINELVASIDFCLVSDYNDSLSCSVHTVLRISIACFGEENEWKGHRQSEMSPKTISNRQLLFLGQATVIFGGANCYF